MGRAVSGASVSKLSDHCVVVQFIVANNAEDLDWEPGEFYQFWYILFTEIHTLSEILKSSRISMKTSARLMPKCDLATSTRSSSMEISTPSCLKCCGRMRACCCFGKALLLSVVHLLKPDGLTVVWVNGRCMPRRNLFHSET